MSVSAAVTILLPWDTPPLSLNDRHASKAAEAALIARVRRDAGWTVKAKRIGHPPHVTVEMRSQPRRRGRRDTDNIVATLKPVCDAIVDAGVVDDDTPEYMTKVMPTIVAPTRSQRTGRLWLIITPRPGRDRPTGGLPDIDG